MFKQLKIIKPIEVSSQILLTLSTCFYVLKSKFSPEKYIKWITNLLSFINNFNLVIYTDEFSFKYIKNISQIYNPRIRVVFRKLEEFHLYKYKDDWITNHNNSELILHKHIDWELNMLWNEKIFFVKDTIQNEYFKTIYYGWCDIGYFRNNPDNIHTNYLKNWPNPKKLLNTRFISNYIHYARVQKNDEIYNNEIEYINKHYKDNLTSHPCSNLLNTFFAGGFFILKENMISSYATFYEEKLNYYFQKKYIIKDDQTILLDIIATNPHMFYIHHNFNLNINEWFVFQLILL